jgi:hypothetical protein
VRRHGPSRHDGFIEWHCLGMRPRTPTVKRSRADRGEYLAGLLVRSGPRMEMGADELAGLLIETLLTARLLSMRRHNDR